MEQKFDEVLEAARKIVNVDRYAEYGPPQASFGRIAELWSAYLGKKITAKDVSLMMVLFKISREVSSPKIDNLVDAAGYTALAHHLK